MASGVLKGCSIDVNVESEQGLLGLLPTGRQEPLFPLVCMAVSSVVG